MQPAIERHNLPDRGLAEVDMVILFQIPFDPPCAGVAVFLLSLTDERYSKLRGFLKNKSFDKVASVKLFLEDVAFDDDLMWMGGDLQKRDPNNPNTWIPIK
jgi:hypothetical protein